MKKLYIGIPLVILAIVIFLISKGSNGNPSKTLGENTEASPIPQTNSVDIDGSRISWFEIENINNLKLIPNFTEKLSAKDTAANNNCKFLSNGPFYSIDNAPLGLFITNGTTLSNWRENSLFDGILSINDFDTPRITRSVPSDNLKIAIQTGPIVKENNNFENLKIQNDSDSRRVVAAVTGENKLYFLVIYNPDSLYSGPLLANLGSVLRDFENKTKLIFADIINLDGGSASTYYVKDIVDLTEFNSSGAFFCQS